MIPVAVTEAAATGLFYIFGLFLIYGGLWIAPSWSFWGNRQPSRYQIQINRDGIGITRKD